MKKTKVIRLIIAATLGAQWIGPAMPAQAEEPVHVAESSTSVTQQVYKLETAEDVQQIRSNPSGRYELTKDIDLSGMAWTPLDFSGQLQGNGFSLTGPDGAIPIFDTLSGAFIDNTVFRVLYHADYLNTSAIARRVESSTLTNLRFPDFSYELRLSGLQNVKEGGGIFGDVSHSELRHISITNANVLFAQGDTVMGISSFGLVAGNSKHTRFEQVSIEGIIHSDVQYSSFGLLTGYGTSITVVDPFIRFQRSDGYGSLGGIFGQLVESPSVSVITGADVNLTHTHADTAYKSAGLGLMVGFGAQLTVEDGRTSIEAVNSRITRRMNGLVLQALGTVMVRDSSVDLIISSDVAEDIYGAGDDLRGLTLENVTANLSVSGRDLRKINGAGHRSSKIDGGHYTLNIEVVPVAGEPYYLSEVYGTANNGMYMSNAAVDFNVTSKHEARDVGSGMFVALFAGGEANVVENMKVKARLDIDFPQVDFRGLIGFKNLESFGDPLPVSVSDSNIYISGQVYGDTIKAIQALEGNGMDIPFAGNDIRMDLRLQGESSIQDIAAISNAGTVLDNEVLFTLDALAPQVSGISPLASKCKIISHNTLTAFSKIRAQEGYDNSGVYGQMWMSQEISHNRYDTNIDWEIGDVDDYASALSGYANFITGSIHDEEFNLHGKIHSNAPSTIFTGWVATPSSPIVERFKMTDLIETSGTVLHHAIAQHPLPLKVREFVYKGNQLPDVVFASYYSNAFDFADAYFQWEEEPTELRLFGNDPAEEERVEASGSNVYFRGTQASGYVLQGVETVPVENLYDKQSPIFSSEIWQHQIGVDAPRLTFAMDNEALRPTFDEKEGIITAKWQAQAGATYVLWIAGDEKAAVTLQGDSYPFAIGQIQDGDEVFLTKQERWGVAYQPHGTVYRHAEAAPEPHDPSEMPDPQPSEPSINPVPEPSTPARVHIEPPPAGSTRTETPIVHEPASEGSGEEESAEPPAEQDHPFSDLSSKDYGYEEIMYLKNRGVIYGTPEMNFVPDRSVTRAEFAIMLKRALHYSSLTPYHYDFKDVNLSAWYGVELTEALNNKITNGFNDRTYRPNTAILREQCAIMLSNVLRNFHLEFKRSATFEDLKEAIAWAQDDIRFAADAGVVGGDEAGRFRPKEQVTRRDAALMIYRLMLLTNDTRDTEEI